MSAAVLEIKPIFDSLKKEFNKSPKDFAACYRIIPKLKLGLLKLNLFPDKEVSSSELIIARDSLEMCCQLSIETENIEEFEKYFIQLKTYYYDFKDVMKNESPYQLELVGCYLLCLLSQNRLAHFHSELELISTSDLLKNAYLKLPVQMEQYLMEGSYNKIFLSQASLPSPRYAFFFNILTNTIRDEIAECMEKSYENIGLDEAAKVLFFNHTEIVPYAQKRGWSVTGSVAGDQRVGFSKGVDTKSVINHEQIITQFVDYAVQLETII